MNTDNMTISGETIDYGPCAFMDAYDPATVFSSIDHGGRYAYGNQPAIAQWNLARLAEALLPLIDDDPDTAVAPPRRRADVVRRPLPAALGRGHARQARPPAPDPELADDLAGLLRAQHVDFTQFFRALVGGDRAATCSSTARRSTRGPRAATRCCRPTAPAVAAAMDRVNPIYIPRNHLVEEALTAATAATSARSAGCSTCLEAVHRTTRAGGLRRARPESCVPYVTYCGT